MKHRDHRRVNPFEQAVRRRERQVEPRLHRLSPGQHHAIQAAEELRHPARDQGRGRVREYDLDPQVCLEQGHDVAEPGPRRHRVNDDQNCPLAP